MDRKDIKKGVEVEIIDNTCGVVFPIGSIGIVTNVIGGPEPEPINYLFDVTVNGIERCCNLSQVRRPLKTKVAKKPTANTGYTAAQLWKELRKRNGGRFPVKKDWVAVTEQRLNAAIKKLQHCA